MVDNQGSTLATPVRLYENALKIIYKGATERVGDVFALDHDEETCSPAGSRPPGPNPIRHTRASQPSRG